MRSPAAACPICPVTLPSSGSMGPAGGFMSALYRPRDGGFVRISDEDWHNASVVGMWRVTFISDGTAFPGTIPAGVIADFGT